MQLINDHVGVVSMMRTLLYYKISSHGYVKNHVELCVHLMKTLYGWFACVEIEGLFVSSPFKSSIVPFSFSTTYMILKEQIEVKGLSQIISCSSV